MSFAYTDTLAVSLAFRQTEGYLTGNRERERKREKKKEVRQHLFVVVLQCNFKPKILS